MRNSRITKEEVANKAEVSTQTLENQCVSMEKEPLYDISVESKDFSSKREDLARYRIHNCVLSLSSCLDNMNISEYTITVSEAEVE